MFEEEFRKRLRDLRIHKNVSARDMSLSIGQNASYINRIENGIMMPSMSVFFFICDYLGITPSEFFNTTVEKPDRLRGLMQQLTLLNSKKIDDISAIVEDMAN